MRFGSEDEPFNLVDISSETRNSAKSMSEFLTSPGNFVYETSFTINEREAYLQDVTGIRFEFFAGKPTSTSIPLREHNFTIEIRQPPTVRKFEPENIRKAILSLKSPLMKDLETVAAPLRAISKQQPISPMPFKIAARMSETDNRKDPAHVISTGKVLGTTPRDVLNFGKQGHTNEQRSQNFDRIGARSSDEALSLHDRRTNLRNSRKSEQNTIINSFLNLKRIEEPSELVRTVPVAMVDVLSNHVEYTRQLTFDKSTLQGFNKIYVRVSGITRPRSVVQVETRRYVIPHSSEINDFLGNAEPPIVLSSESSFGKVSFLLKRNDPTLEKVSIVRVTKNPNLSRSVFETVGVVEFGNADTINFTDFVDNVAPNTVIYRFIVQNSDGTHGEFTSSVLNSYTKVTDQKKVLSSTTPISIRALNTKDGIDISVDTINDQVYSIRLLRQDLGAIGEFSSTVTTILDEDGRYSQVIAGERKTLSFLDRNVVTGRHYRYFAAYRLGTDSSASLCQETLSDEDEIIVRYVASNRLPFTSNVTPASSFQDESNNTTVQFDVTVSEVEEQYNVLLDALQQAGVSQQFITDLQNDRQKARQVAAFLIERVDRVTGKRVSFGIIAPGKFSDSPEIRSKLNLPDPIPGRKYEYVCKLCIRPPSTFLLTATIGFTATGDTSGNITEVLAAKFQNALIGRGILPSEKQLRDGLSIRENFFLGLTGLEISTAITLPQFGPKIENLTTKRRPLYTLIKWSTAGDVSEISYFLIYCNYNGVDELLGTVSSIGRNSTYQYKDTTLHNEVGNKTYFVKMVTLDHDVSIPSPKVEVITDFSIPTPVLDGYILSPSRYEVKGVILLGPGPSFPVQSSGISQSVPAATDSIIDRLVAPVPDRPLRTIPNLPVANILPLRDPVIEKRSTSVPDSDFSRLIPQMNTVDMGRFNASNDVPRAISSAGLTTNLTQQLVANLGTLGLTFNPTPRNDSLTKIVNLAAKIPVPNVPIIGGKLIANAGVETGKSNSANVDVPRTKGFI